MMMAKEIATVACPCTTMDMAGVTDGKIQMVPNLHNQHLEPQLLLLRDEEQVGLIDHKLK